MGLCVCVCVLSVFVLSSEAFIHIKKTLFTLCPYYVFSAGMGSAFTLPGFGQQASGTSLFGQPSVTSLFGQPSVTSLFGQPSGASTMGTVRLSQNKRDTEKQRKLHSPFQ